MTIQLGDRVRDRISGFEGVVVGVTEWLYNCRRPIVQPSTVGTNGKPIESQSFDEPQLEVLEPAAFKAHKTEERAPAKTTCSIQKCNQCGRELPVGFVVTDQRRMRMRYEVFEDRLTPGDWRVEAFDEQGEGQVYITMFIGPAARERAEEYAAWKSAQSPALSGTSR